MRCRVGQRDILLRGRGSRRVIRIVDRRIALFQGGKVFAYCTAWPITLAPFGGVGTHATATPFGVRLDDAGIHRKPFTSYKAFAHAAPQHALEHVAQSVAIAEASVPILRKGRVVRDCILQAKATEPSIGQVQVDLFAEPTLGANAETVAYDKHAHHQFGIDRWPAGMAIERRKVTVQIAEIEDPIDTPKQMTLRNMIVKVERVKELVLHATLMTHHVDALLGEMQST